MGGRLLQILSLRRGANSKRGAYLKLGANSSIYGKYYFFYQESLKPAQTSFVCESPGKYTKCYPLPLRTIFFSLLIMLFFLECLLLNLHSFSGTFQLNIFPGHWCLQQFKNCIRCRLQNSPFIPVVKYAHFAHVACKARALHACEKKYPSAFQSNSIFQ